MANPELWLQQRRLTAPPRTDRRQFGVPVADVARHADATEAATAAALTAAGYSIDAGHVNMLRLYWRAAIGPQPKDDPTRRQHVDRVAAAWQRQLGVGAVGTAVLLGGELRDAIRDALAPDEPTAARLAKFIEHGRAKGDRYAFELVSTGPRQYGVQEAPDDFGDIA